MIDIVPNTRRKNHVEIYYNGHLVAEGIDFHNGWFEVRPKPSQFSPLDRLNKMMTPDQIEELCGRSYARHYAKRERFK